MRIVATFLLPLLAFPLSQAWAKTVAPLPGPSVTRVSTGTRGLFFALAPGRCETANECAAVVELLDGHKLLDTFPLAFAASDARLKKAPDETMLGVAAGLGAWTAGTEEGAVTTALQGVRLTAHRSPGARHRRRCGRGR